MVNTSEFRESESKYVPRLRARFTKL